MTPSENLRDTYRNGDSRVFESERLVLRTPRVEDAQAITDLAGDRRVAENTARIPHPYAVDDALNWISFANSRPGQETFVITQDDDVIGAIGFDLNQGPDPEVGYWIGVPYWGQGFATEALRALVDHAFENHEFTVLVGGARVTNIASRRVQEKCGFQWTGVGLYRLRAINSSTPCDRFRLDRRTWASLKPWGRAKRAV